MGTPGSLAGAFAVVSHRPAGWWEFLPPQLRPSTLATLATSGAQAVGYNAIVLQRGWSLYPTQVGRQFGAVHQARGRLQRAVSSAAVTITAPPPGTPGVRAAPPVAAVLPSPASSSLHLFCQLSFRSLDQPECWQLDMLQG